ncbi:PepSY domain-containing protein [Geodermatophilus sabuli]|uniref:PepSY domain-containing protein n=1 Tax=Geodermatophilus sabuli TaxID=1564158 RepID=A0A285EFA3_9ACTN|nr:PepSY domain-containing protein [Geodermatophilus sabuli]MBB3086240.1 hypothetical protein [Geodermatophilus sabuli]SNX97543.1 hypothetical protein SAMN06893097_107187 [Geodermatophilus sabuli]
MRRPSAPSRRVIGFAAAIAVCAGIGFGAYTLGSAGADSSYLPRVASVTTTPVAPADPAAPAGPEVPGGPGTTPPAGTPLTTPLTLEQAKEVALQVAPPGRVVEVDEDLEPTGSRYDVTVLHDNYTATEVEVDTVTGQVTSIATDDDWDGS